VNEEDGGGIPFLEASKQPAGAMTVGGRERQKEGGEHSTEHPVCLPGVVCSSVEGIIILI
jgi:hypothetical protein